MILGRGCLFCLTLLRIPRSSESPVFPSPQLLTSSPTALSSHRWLDMPPQTITLSWRLNPGAQVSKASVQSQLVYCRTPTVSLLTDCVTLNWLASRARHLTSLMLHEFGAHAAKRLQLPHRSSRCITSACRKPIYAAICFVRPSRITNDNALFSFQPSASYTRDEQSSHSLISYRCYRSVSRT